METKKKSQKRQYASRPRSRFDRETRVRQSMHTRRNPQATGRREIPSRHVAPNPTTPTRWRHQLDWRHRVTPPFLVYFVTPQEKENPAFTVSSVPPATRGPSWWTGTSPGECTCAPSRAPVGIQRKSVVKSTEGCSSHGYSHSHQKDGARARGTGQEKTTIIIISIIYLSLHLNPTPPLFIELVSLNASFILLYCTVCTVIGWSLALLQGRPASPVCLVISLCPSIFSAYSFASEGLRKRRACVCACVLMYALYHVSKEICMCMRRYQGEMCWFVYQRKCVEGV